jgi:hypothetical protein
VALKSCTVIIQDLNQTEHALDVTAETLYEAVALKGMGWIATAVMLFASIAIFLTWK